MELLFSLYISLLLILLFLLKVRIQLKSDLAHGMLTFLSLPADLVRCLLLHVCRCFSLILLIWSIKYSSGVGAAKAVQSLLLTIYTCTLNTYIQRRLHNVLYAGESERGGEGGRKGNRDKEREDMKEILLIFNLFMQYFTILIPFNISANFSNYLSYAS